MARTEAMMQTIKDQGLEVGIDMQLLGACLGTNGFHIIDGCTYEDMDEMEMFDFAIDYI